MRAGTGPRRGVPGAQWAATVFCRHYRSPEPLVCHWVARGECLIEGNADPAAFAVTIPVAQLEAVLLLAQLECFFATFGD